MLCDRRCPVLVFVLPILICAHANSCAFIVPGILPLGNFLCAAADHADHLYAACRTRYNQYNSDVDTKAMRASAPLIPVWDDHEFAK
jgi:hypothetical protein